MDINTSKPPDGACNVKQAVIIEGIRFFHWNYCQITSFHLIFMREHTNSGEEMEGTVLKIFCLCDQTLVWKKRDEEDRHALARAERITVGYGKC